MNEWRMMTSRESFENSKILRNFERVEEKKKKEKY